jgi:hypothetical protein
MRRQLLNCCMCNTINHCGVMVDVFCYQFRTINYRFHRLLACPCACLLACIGVTLNLPIDETTWISAFKMMNVSLISTRNDICSRHYTTKTRQSDLPSVSDIASNTFSVAVYILPSPVIPRIPSTVSLELLWWTRHLYMMSHLPVIAYLPGITPTRSPSPPFSDLLAMLFPPTCFKLSNSSTGTPPTYKHFTPDNQKCFHGLTNMRYVIFMQFVHSTRLPWL